MKNLFLVKRHIENLIYHELCESVDSAEAAGVYVSDFDPRTKVFAFKTTPPTADEYERLDRKLIRHARQVARAVWHKKGA